MSYEVTIGIPVYNVERHIRQTIDSALAQTFQSIEFLFCDDCGSDSSIEIVKEYQTSHPRGKDIRIVHQPQNMGIGEARNRMIAEASGRYFYSLDADDTIREDTIALLYDTAQKYDAEIVYGSREHVYLSGGKKDRVDKYPYPFKVFSKPDEYAAYVYGVGIQVQNWNFLIMIDIFRRNHLKVTPVGHGYGEDYTFTVDLPTYITRAVLLPDITYFYYIEAKTNGTSRRKQLSRQQMDKALAAIDQKKRRTELRDKPYYAKRCAMLMMYDFHFAIQIINRRKEASPPYTDKDIRNIMKHPMPLKDIIKSKQSVVKNLMYWLFGVLPPRLSVLFISIAGRISHPNGT